MDFRAPKSPPLSSRPRNRTPAWLETLNQQRSLSPELRPVGLKHFTSPSAKPSSNPPNEAQQAIIDSQGYRYIRTLNARFKYAYLCEKRDDKSQMVFMFTLASSGASDLSEEYRLLQGLKSAGATTPDTSQGSDSSVGGPWLKQQFIPGVHHKLEDLVNPSEGQLMKIIDGEVFGEASIAFGLGRRPVGRLSPQQKVRLQNFVTALDQFDTRQVPWWGDAQFIIDPQGVPHFMDPLDVRGGNSEAKGLAEANLANLNHLKRTAKALLQKQSGNTSRRQARPTLAEFAEIDEGDEDED